MSIYHECQYQETPESSACGFYPEAGIHLSAESCSEDMGRPCDRPWEHHTFSPRPDVNTELSDAETATIIDALEVFLSLPGNARRSFGRDDAVTQALHDRLMAYLDLVEQGEAP